MTTQRDEEDYEGGLADSSSDDGNPPEPLVSRYDCQGQESSRVREPFKPWPTLITLERDQSERSRSSAIFYEQELQVLDSRRSSALMVDLSTRAVPAVSHTEISPAPGELLPWQPPSPRFSRTSVAL